MPSIVKYLEMFFRSCAHEYESRQEMAAAALAYKCMEVAYMRVVYCKHSSTNRDRCELQSTLQVVSQGNKAQLMSIFTSGGLSGSIVFDHLLYTCTFLQAMNKQN